MLRLEVDLDHVRGAELGLGRAVGPRQLESDRLDVHREPELARDAHRAAEVAGANIFVNAIAPGGVQTEAFGELLERMGEEKRNQLFQVVPLGRLGTPEEYASLAVYLGCDGHYLVGQVISPNGGMC